MDPGDFIGLARDIVDHIDQISPDYSEAAYRTSISRIYYGLLHWFQNRLAITVPRSKVKTYHSYVIEQLESVLDDEILIDFRFVMKARVDADYFLAILVGFNTFKECLNCSERIMNDIECGLSRRYDADDDLKFFKETRDTSDISAQPPHRKEK
jgi:hypothetical protein